LVDARGALDAPLGDVDAALGPNGPWRIAHGPFDMTNVSLLTFALAAFDGESRLG
jgi:hypothetical protein